jgi:hypothetical protein
MVNLLLNTPDIPYYMFIIFPNTTFHQNLSLNENLSFVNMLSHMHHMYISHVVDLQTKFNVSNLSDLIKDEFKQ